MYVVLMQQYCTYTIQYVRHCAHLLVHVFATENRQAPLRGESDYFRDSVRVQLN